MPDLKTIDLSNNKIQGSIPSDFLGKKHYLEFCNIFDFRFHI